MLTVKQFIDGGRLYVVFEGAELESAQNLIKEVLERQSGCVNTVSPVAAKPVETKEIVPEMKPVFTDGEYTGMTACDVINKAENKNRALVFLNTSLVDCPSDDLYKDIYQTLRGFVKDQFKTVIPEQFAKALTDAQVNVFYLRYCNIVSETGRANICISAGLANYDALLNAPVEVKRAYIADIIEDFK